MRLQDMHLEKFFYPVFAIIALAFAFFAAPYLVKFINWLLNRALSRQHAKRAASMRAEGAGPNARTRQTDIFALMTSIDRQRYREAEELQKAGDLLKAALLFESIKFQRRAIDILEKGGLVDEACAMLVRMKVPGRAGAVYERNKMYDKAAYYFLLGNQFDNAARAYSRLAATDFRYYMSAADAYFRANKIEEMLQAYANILQTDKIIEHCVNRKHWAFLMRYCHDPVTARNVCAQLTEAQQQEFINSLEATPQTIQSLASWTHYSERESLVLPILHLAQKNQLLCRHFWLVSPQAIRTHLIQVYKTNLAKLDRDEVKRNAEGLEHNQLFREAADLYLAVGELQLARLSKARAESSTQLGHNAA